MDRNSVVITQWLSRDCLFWSGSSWFITRRILVSSALPGNCPRICTVSLPPKTCWGCFLCVLLECISFVQNKHSFAKWKRTYSICRWRQILDTDILLKMSDYTICCNWSNVLTDQLWPKDKALTPVNITFSHQQPSFLTPLTNNPSLRYPLLQMY